MSFVIIDGVGYETESKTLFRNMSSYPGATRRRIINNLVKRLKGDGTWNLLDVLWVLAAHDQQASRINWKSPSTFTITEVNSPTWTKDQGYTGNGSNMYLNTGWDPFNNGVNYTQNNAAFGIYMRTSASGAAQYDIGARTASPNSYIAINAKWSDNKYYLDANDATAVDSGTGVSTQGLLSGSRTSSSEVTAYRNGVSTGTSSAASAQKTSQDVFILAYNNNGSAASYSSRQISMAFIGSGSINHLLLFNAIEEYMDAIGTGVV